MLGPDIGSTAKYSFTTEFATLNGIYTLLTLETFEAALANGVDFVASLYTPAAIANPTTAYNNEWTSYQGKPIYQLKSVTSGNTIYAPETIINLVPNTSVQQYDNYYLAIMLGTFGANDVTKITWLLDQLNNLTQSITGTTNTAHIYSSGKTWLTQADYDTLEATRAANIQSVTTDYAALQAQIAENLRLRNLINYYETALKTLAVDGHNP